MIILLSRFPSIYLKLNPNFQHFLGISHRGSPLLGMGEVCVRIDKKLTNKLQLASINCNQVNYHKDILYNYIGI